MCLHLDFGFGPRKKAFFALLGNGIFNQEGEPWRHSRRLLRQQMTRMQYQKLDRFKEHTDNLLNVLHRQGGIVDLQPLLYRYTLDMSTALLFGRSVGSLINEGRDSFAESFRDASNTTAFRARLGDLYWIYTPVNFTNSCKAVKRFVDEYVRNALDSRSEDNDRPAQDDSDQYRFIRDLQNDFKDPVTVRDQLVNVLLAGRDSTASLMSWTM